MNCPRCDSPAETRDLQQFGGVCPKCLLDFAAEQDAPSFPNLEILSTIGEGGMGVVYKAVQKQLGRTVALKVLSPQLSSDPSFVERFTREARALAQLSHPNIVSIFDSGVHDGVPYLVMEFVDGTPLRKMLAARKLSSEDALRLVPQICDALQYAHRQGIVHRDIKPENILIDREGRVKIADFGLAKLAEPDQTRITRTNVVMGTPHYMAPEQIENPSAVDHRADIYSLGVIFYEMLTGELPLGRFKPPSEKAPVDRRLDRVVLKSLEKEPADRYQSAEEVKTNVAGLGARREIRTDSQAKGRSEKPLLLAAAILTVLAIALGDTRRPLPSVSCGLAALGCILVALKRRARARSEIRPSTLRPALRIVTENPFRKQALSLVILAGGFILTGLTLDWARLKGFSVPILALGVFLLLCSILFGFLSHRGTGRGLGLAITLLVILGLLFVSLFVPSSDYRAEMHARANAKRTSSEEPTVVEVPPGHPEYHGTRLLTHSRPFRISDVWPTDQDLAGLTRESESEGPRAIWEGRLPEGLGSAVTVIRRCTFVEGSVELLGFDFKSEPAQARWMAEVGHVLESDLRGRSLQVFLLRDTGGVLQDSTARSIHELLRKKIEASADRGD
jgi:predicted Ser/Thr protein kinase